MSRMSRNCPATFQNSDSTSDALPAFLKIPETRVEDI